MCKVYGYCRISTQKQSIERQVRNIQAAYPEAIIVREAYTGTKVQGRKEFEKLLKVVRSGDTIVFDAVSRMSRNAEEGFALYRDLFERGIELKFIKDPHIDTAVYKADMEAMPVVAIDCGDADTNEYINTIMAATVRYALKLAERQFKLSFLQAEKEVEQLHQRTKEGIETARRAGKQIGAVPGRKIIVKKAAPTKEIIKMHCKAFGGSLSDIECMKLAGLARNTYYKYKAEIKEELA